MPAYLKELSFDSPDQTYIKEITSEINNALGQVPEEQGLVVVRSKHTTLGLIVNETTEPNLLTDITRFSRILVPEDQRATWVSAGDYQFPVTQEYLHACMDSPLRPPDEVDEDFNAGRHIRAMIFAQPYLSLPFRDRRIELGRYQGIAAFEFDGRNGEGINPLRQRVVQVWIYPFDRLIIL